MNDHELIDQYIEPNPYHPGIADARLRGYGVSVRALIAYDEAVHHDVDRVARDYRLPREAVEAALAYYRQHQDVIDARRAADVA